MDWYGPLAGRLTCIKSGVLGHCHLHPPPSALRIAASQPTPLVHCFRRRFSPSMIFRLPALTILFSFATIAFAGPTNYGGGRKCGNHPSLEHINEKESKFADALSRLGVSTRIASEFSNHTISVYFNVISSGTQYAQGCIPYVMSHGPFLLPSKTCFLRLLYRVPEISRSRTRSTS